MNKPSYWNRISEIQAKQEKKGIRSYGQRIEDNNSVSMFERLKMLEEELVDALMYIEWIKDFMSSWCRSDDNKYHWHDLRKNPEDLPERFVPVLIDALDLDNVVAYFDTEDCWVVDYNDDFCSEKEDKTVIAWKYIEAFEEVE